MADRRVISTTGIVLDESTIQEFKVDLHSKLIRPDDEGYEAGRKVWNGMIDKRPALVARCIGLPISSVLPILPAPIISW